MDCDLGVAIHGINSTGFWSPITDRAKLEAEDTLKYHTVEIASPPVVREYVQSMRTLLEESSIMSRKAFLRSFVERIEVDDSYAKVIYTWPPGDPPTETVGVLPIGHDGPPFRSKGKTFEKTFPLVF